MEEKNALRGAPDTQFQRPVAVGKYREHTGRLNSNSHASGHFRMMRLVISAQRRGSTERGPASGQGAPDASSHVFHVLELSRQASDALFQHLVT